MERDTLSLHPVAPQHLHVQDHGVQNPSTAWTWRWKHYNLWNFNQWHSVTLHKTSVFTSFLLLKKKLTNHSNVAVLRMVVFWIIQHVVSYVITKILEKPAAWTSSDTEYEAACVSGTSVLNYQTTWHHILENHNVDIHFCDQPKSHVYNCGSIWRNDCKFSHFSEQVISQWWTMPIEENYNCK